MGVEVRLFSDSATSDLMITKLGNTTVNDVGSSVTTTTTNHNLGYTPFFLVFRTFFDGTGATPIPEVGALSITANVRINIQTQVDGRISGTSLLTDFYDSSGSNNIVYDVVYYLFRYSL